MKIRIDQIPEAGLEICESPAASNLDLDRADIKFKQPISLCAKITKGINNITVQAKIKALMYMECNRCLDQFTLPLERNINLNLLIGDKKEIDISQNLREEIIVNLPLKPLCRLDCQGLCPVCGRNLNQGACSCNPVKP